MRSLVCAALVVLVGFGSSTARAHHSVSGQLDMSKTVTLKGVISGVEWVNPHIYVHVDVSAENGTTNTWRLETFPPAQMRRAGLTKELIMGKSGEMVTVTILPARDGTLHLGYI